MDILDILNRGSATVISHDDGTELRRAALDFINAYKCHSGASVYAASPHAERVLGAAMMLCPYVRGGCDGETVIFDVSFSSGTLVSRAIDTIRANGNTSPLHAIVLQCLVPEQSIPRPKDLASFAITSGKKRTDGSSRQQGESSDSRILLSS